MQRLLFLFAFLILASTCVRAQTFQKATGIQYYDTRPTHNPTAPYGTEVVLALDDRKFYIYNRDSLEWYPQEVSAGSSYTFEVFQDSIIRLFENGALVSLDTIRGVSGGGGGGGDVSFDSDRPVLRTPQAGTVIGGSTLQDFANYFYYTPPTLALTLSPTNSLYEIGTVNSIDLNTATTNPSNADLAFGNLDIQGGDNLLPFSGQTSTSTPFSFAPGAPSGRNELTYTFIATQNYGGEESGTMTSPTRTIKGVYPILYGVSATDLHAGGDPYTVLTKAVLDESSVSRNIDGTGFIYYAFPETWAIDNLVSIIDGNGFNVTPSFTVQTISVSSSGLTNNWTTNYRIYKLNNTTTVSNATYQFNR